MRIKHCPTWWHMMTSWNGNIFRVTGHLCGEFTSHRWIPRTKASKAELWCFFDIRLNKRVSKQSWGWWFETPARPLWHHNNAMTCFYFTMTLTTSHTSIFCMGAVGISPSVSWTIPEVEFTASTLQLVQDNVSSALPKSCLTHSFATAKSQHTTSNLSIGILKCVVTDSPPAIWIAIYLHTSLCCHATALQTHWNHTGPLFTKRTDVLRQDLAKSRSREIRV